MTTPELDEEIYLEQMNRFNDCYVVKNEHFKAVEGFCKLLSQHGVLRVCFRVGSEKHAQRFPDIVADRHPRAQGSAP